MTDEDADAYRCEACGFTRESLRGVKSHIGHKKSGRLGNRNNGHTDETQAIPLYQKGRLQDVKCPECGDLVQQDLLGEHVEKCFTTDNTQKITGTTREV